MPPLEHTWRPCALFFGEGAPRCARAWEELFLTVGHICLQRGETLLHLYRSTTKHKAPMQYASFSNGEQGYVLHKITGNWSGHCSAWYDKDGNLLDAQQIVGTWTRICRPVKRNGPIWRELATTGRAYATRPQRHAEERMIAAAVAVRSINA